MKKFIKKNKLSIYNIGVWLLLFIISLLFKKSIGLVIFAIIHIVLLIVMFKLWSNNNYYTMLSKLYNIHHFGARRRGKDLSFQLSIIKRFNNKKHLKNDFNYLSNVDYGYGCKLIDLQDLKLIDKKTNKLLNYNDIITGAYKNMEFEKIDEYEGLDLYISDAQLGLPNTEHNALDKMYPWLPPFIALAGQLYNMNIHVNTQEYNRLWIKLRGQQDIYVRSIKTLPMNKSFLQKIYDYIPFLNKYIFFKVRIYDNVNSAEQNILPYNAKALSNELLKHGYLTSGQATKEQYKATHGEITEKWLALKKSDIKYDSRIFHEYIFGKKFSD